MQVKDAAASAAKWGTRASAASSTYGSGVQATTKDQAALAAAAEGLWASQVAAAAGAKRFSAGLTRAGTPAWKAGVASVGVARYQQGVSSTIAQQKYQTRVQPFFAALASLTLSNRGAKGTNGGRTDAVVNAEMAVKKAQH